LSYSDLNIIHITRTTHPGHVAASCNASVSLFFHAFVRALWRCWKQNV